MITGPVSLRTHTATHLLPHPPPRNNKVQLLKALCSDQGGGKVLAHHPLSLTQTPTILPPDDLRNCKIKHNSKHRIRFHLHVQIHCVKLIKLSKN